MRFADHKKLVGEHAFLSASKYSWLNYDEEKLISAFKSAQAAALGTRLHALAAEHIRLGMRMPRNSATFNAYVNDAIGFKMMPEQVLYYSINCFGTADAISFDEKRRVLRVHDLKTGTSRASMAQLKVYTALFCLEYQERPLDMRIELRIYQNDEVVVEEADGQEILEIMDRIVYFDKLIEDAKEDE